MSVKIGLQLLLSAAARVWLLCLPFACEVQQLIREPLIILKLEFPKTCVG